METKLHIQMSTFDMRRMTGGETRGRANNNSPGKTYPTAFCLVRMTGGETKWSLVGRCVPNAHPIISVSRRYFADSKFESALDPVNTSR